MPKRFYWLDRQGKGAKEMPVDGIPPTTWALDEIYAGVSAYSKQLGPMTAESKGSEFRLGHLTYGVLEEEWFVVYGYDFSYKHGEPIFAWIDRGAFETELYQEHGWTFQNTLQELFQTSIQVIWAVDALSDEVIHVYRKDNTTQPIIYRRGDIANAEPALPGWSMPVDDLFVD